MTAQRLDIDGNPIGNPDTKTVIQNEIGRVRQQYVDNDLHPEKIDSLSPITKVPLPTEFSVARHPTIVGSNYEIFTAWVASTESLVLNEANSNGIYAEFPRSIVLLYITGRFLGESKQNFRSGSSHMWGFAIDFATDNTEKGYNDLKLICEDFGVVVWEGTYNHVHVQRYHVKQLASTSTITSSGRSPPPTTWIQQE